MSTTDFDRSQSDHPAEPSVGSGPPNTHSNELPRPLSQLFAQTKAHFARQLDAVLKSIEDDLFELAKNSHQQQDQDEYFQAIREVRAKKSAIKSDFLENLARDFADLMEEAIEADERSTALASELESLSLIGYDEVDAIVAKETLISRNNKRYSVQLSQLAGGLDKIAKRKVTLKNLPMGPHSLCTAWEAAIVELTLDARTKLLCFKLFDQLLLDALSAKYDSFNKTLISFGIFPEMDQSPSAKSSELKSETLEGGAIKSQATKNQATKSETTNSKATESQSIKSEATNSQTTKREQEYVSAPHSSGYATSSNLKEQYNQAFDDSSSHGLGGQQRLNAGGTAGAYSTQPTSSTRSAIGQPVGNAGRAVPNQTSLTVNAQEKWNNARAGVDAVGQLPEIGLGSSGESNVRGEYLAAELKARHHPDVAPNHEFQVVKNLNHLFDTLIDTETLTPSPLVSKLLRQIQAPLAKSIANDDQFFTTEQNAVRQWLTTFYHSAMHCHGQTEADAVLDPLYKKLNSLASRISEYKNPNDINYPELLNELDIFLSKDQHRAKLFEKRVIEVEKGKHKTQSVEKKIQQLLTKMTKGKPVRKGVLDFHHKAWKNVLLFIGLKHGLNSAQWKDCVNTLEGLLLAMAPHDASEDKKGALDHYNGIRKKIRDGLKCVNLDQVASERWIRLLDTVFKASHGHASSSREAKPECEWVENLEDDHAVPNQNGPAVWFKDSSLSKVFSVSIEDRPPNAPQAAFVAQAKHLARGAWFELKQANQAVRCRLAAIIGEYNKYIFVSRAGKKIADMTLDEVAYALESQNLISFDSSQIFDQALQALVQESRRAHSQGLASAKVVGQPQ